MRDTRLCLYSYDALNRLVGTSPIADAESRRFYCKNRLATEIQGQLKHSIFQDDDQILAQKNSSATTVDTLLVTTDQQRSALNTVNANTIQPIAYSPYGFRSVKGLPSLMGFNGERRDPVTGRYILGNGYRPYNPVLMRFDIPDSWSPFGKGGLNLYAYCLGDPINRRDPNGHVSLIGSFIRFAELANIKPRNVAAQIVGTSVSRQRAITLTPLLEPISMPPFTYQPMGASMRTQNGSGLGSLESIGSSRSTNSMESTFSALSGRSLGSSTSISSSGSARSTATASSGSRRRSVSTGSDWSGSGRRHDIEWGSNESLSSVSSYASVSATRVTFEDTVLAFDIQANVSFRRDTAPSPVLQIRRQ